jgi:hypothetical protein
VLTEEKREVLENCFKEILTTNQQEEEDEKIEKLEDFNKNMDQEEEEILERKKSYISHTLVEGLTNYMGCKEKRKKKQDDGDDPPIRLGTRLKTTKVKRNGSSKEPVMEEEDTEFNMSMPSETPYIDYKNTVYCKVLTPFADTDTNKMISMYRDVKQDLLELFEGLTLEGWEDTCKIIKKAFDEFASEEAEEKYIEEEKKKMMETGVKREIAKEYIERKKWFNTITILWTEESNIFRWINKALFLDVVKLVFKTEEPPKYFEKAFPGLSADFYATVLEKCAKFMILLNMYIEEQSDRSISTRLYRGLNCTALKYADIGEKYRFVQYTASSLKLTEAKKFLEYSDVKKKTIFQIDKPKDCKTTAWIVGTNYGKSRIPDEKEYLTIPYSVFTLEASNANYYGNLKDIEDGRRRDIEIGTTIVDRRTISQELKMFIDKTKNKIKKKREKLDEFTYCELKLEKGKVNKSKGKVFIGNMFNF